jgi:hypothetical protein
MLFPVINRTQVNAGSTKFQDVAKRLSGAINIDANRRIAAKCGEKRRRSDIDDCGRLE